MNNELKFIEQFVTPRAGIIEQRNNALSWELNPHIPNYLSDRVYDIRAMYLLGLDNVLGKFLPIFMEDILINIVIGFFSDHVENVSKLQNKYERLDGWKILDELKENKVLNNEDEEFCSKFYGAIKYRNNEVHNKELKKFKSKDFITVNNDTNEKTELDPFFKKHVMNTPWLMRELNTNALVEEIPSFTVGVINLLQRNVFLLNRIDSLIDKNIFDSQEKGIKFIVSINDQDKIDLIKQALEVNQFIEDMRIDENGQYHITMKRKLTRFDVINLEFIVTGSVSIQIEETMN